MNRTFPVITLSLVLLAGCAQTESHYETRYDAEGKEYRTVSVSQKIDLKRGMRSSRPVEVNENTRIPPMNEMTNPGQ